MARFLASWLGFCCLLNVGLLSSAAACTQLLMVERAGCRHCELWLAEIGDRYALTKEGRQAPLRRLDVEQVPAVDLPQSVAEISLTPSFILIHNGVEIDRLIGYAGDDFFWFQLRQMLDKLPAH